MTTTYVAFIKTVFRTRGETGRLAFFQNEHDSEKKMLAFVDGVHFENGQNHFPTKKIAIY